MKIVREPLLRVVLTMVALAPWAAAYAHRQEGLADGFTAGFMHPILGPDHLVAMVAVGLWGAILGNPAIWILPIAFPTVMALGGVLGVLGIPLPFIELAISLSAVLLGLVVLIEYRAPLVLAAVLVSVFAIFHGYAHGAELPGAVNPLAYGVGFVMATGLLHLAGILIGLLVHWQWGHWVVRASGAIVAAVGVYFLVGNIGLRA